MKTKLIKSLFLSTLVAGSALLASCDENSGIEIGVPQTQTVIYKIDPFTGTVISKSDTITSDLDSLLAEQNATRDDITGIDLTDLTLSMTDSNGTLLPNANFNNIKYMNINISEVGGVSVPMANYDSASMATTYHDKNSIANSDISVSNPFSLLSYVSKPSFAVQLNGALYSPVTTSFYVKSTMTINIKVKL